MVFVYQKIEMDQKGLKMDQKGLKIDEKSCLTMSIFPTAYILHCLFSPRICIEKCVPM